MVVSTSASSLAPAGAPKTKAQEPEGASRRGRAGMYAGWLLAAALCAVTLLGLEAYAGGSGDSTAGNITGAFDDIQKMLKSLMQGTLGAVISLSLILCGSFIAVKTQSFWAFIMGIVMAIGLYYSPTVIETISTDTVTAADAPASPSQAAAAFGAALGGS